MGNVRKNFIGRQQVPIRPPYGRIEGDEMVSFDSPGKWWGVNTATPRIDGRDQEHGRRLYLAIERGDLKFTAYPSVVDYGGNIPRGRVACTFPQIRRSGGGVHPRILLPFRTKQICRSMHGRTAKPASRSRKRRS